MPPATCCWQPVISVNKSHMPETSISRHPLVTTNIVCLAILFIQPAACQGRVEPHGAIRRFISEKYDFSMAVPPGWGVSTELDTPVFFYSPPSATFGQATIPKGGATITVEARASESGLVKSARNPDEWARLDAQAFGSGSASIKPVQMPKESGASNAVLSSYDEPTLSRDQEKVRSVGVFWQFDGTLFAAHLRYNQGDPSALQFEKVLLQTIGSMRPLRAARW